MADPFAELRAIKPGSLLEFKPGPEREDTRWPADANRYSIGTVAIDSWELNPDGTEKEPARGLASALVATRFNPNHDEQGRFAEGDGSQGELPLTGGGAKPAAKDDYFVKAAKRLGQPIVKEKPSDLTSRLGDDVDGKAVAASLAKFETKGRAGRVTEALTAIDPDGEVAFLKEGSERYVTVQPDEIDSLTDAVLSHNHPSGTSFSPEDIHLAAHANAREIRAFGTNSLGDSYLHVMSRVGDRWPDIPRISFEFTKANDAVRSEFTPRINAGTMSLSQANSEHYHEVWQRVVGALQDEPSGGMRYERRKIKI